MGHLLESSSGDQVMREMWYSGIGSGQGEYYHLSLSNTRAYPTPVSICVSPSTSHLAWFQKVSSTSNYPLWWILIHQGQKSVYVLAINKKGQAVGMPQEMRHPREIDWIGWRKSVASSQVKCPFYPIPSYLLTD